jgi:hypothetical protein
MIASRRQNFPRPSLVCGGSSPRITIRLMVRRDLTRRTVSRARSSSTSSRMEGETVCVCCACGIATTPTRRTSAPFGFIAYRPRRSSHGVRRAFTRKRKGEWPPPVVSNAQPRAGFEFPSLDFQACAALHGDLATESPFLTSESSAPFALFAESRLPRMDYRAQPCYRRGLWPLSTTSRCWRHDLGFH